VLLLAKVLINLPHSGSALNERACFQDGYDFLLGAVQLMCQIADRICLRRVDVRELFVSVSEVRQDRIALRGFLTPLAEQ